MECDTSFKPTATPRKKTMNADRKSTTSTSFRSLAIKPSPPLRYTISRSVSSCGSTTIPCETKHSSPGTTQRSTPVVASEHVTRGFQVPSRFGEDEHTKGKGSTASSKYSTAGRTNKVHDRETEPVRNNSSGCYMNVAPSIARTRKNRDCYMNVAPKVPAANEKFDKKERERNFVIKNPSSSWPRKNHLSSESPAAEKKNYSKSPIRGGNALSSIAAMVTNYSRSSIKGSNAMDAAAATESKTKYCGSSPTKRGSSTGCNAAPRSPKQSLKTNPQLEAKQGSTQRRRPVRPAPPCPKKLKDKPYMKSYRQEPVDSDDDDGYSYIDPLKIRYLASTEQSNEVDTTLYITLMEPTGDTRKDYPDSSGALSGNSESNTYASLIAISQDKSEGIYTVPVPKPTLRRHLSELGYSSPRPTNQLDLSPQSSTRKLSSESGYSSPNWKEQVATSLPSSGFSTPLKDKDDSNESVKQLNRYIMFNSAEEQKQLTSGTIYMNIAPRITKRSKSLTMDTTHCTKEVDTSITNHEPDISITTSSLEEVDTSGDTSTTGATSTSGDTHDTKEVEESSSSKDEGNEYENITYTPLPVVTVNNATVHKVPALK